MGITIWKTVFMECDNYDNNVVNCWVSRESLIGWGQRKQSAYNIFKREGWTIVDGLAYCPSCSELNKLKQ